MHGGVYVPVSETTQPNPYLKDPQRDVVTLDGQKLTKLNPAYMTRQMSELQRSEYGIQSHITSLNPIRPENEADPWEKNALLAFENGVGEAFELTDFGSRKMLRYMAPLFTERACLQCHEAQGYKEGDIRGGISVSMPSELQMRNIRGQFMVAGVVYPSICILGLLGLVFRHRYKRTQESHLEISKKVEKLTKENSTKEAFLSMISHDSEDAF